MARHHAPLLTSIWDDPDFVALPAGAQRLYMQILSQKRLSLCGVLPFSARNLARGCVDLSVDVIEEDLAVLAERGYVWVDLDTDELWVRTILKHDPPRGSRTIKGMWNDWLEIDSEQIRQRVIHSISDEIWDAKDVEIPEAAKALRNTPWDTPPDGSSTNREPIENETGAATCHLPPATSRVPNASSSQHNSHLALVPPADDDDFESTLDVIIDARCAGRRIDNPRAYRAKVRAEAIDLDGELIRRMLADGDRPDAVAAFVLRAGFVTEQERAKPSVPWCGPECPTCDGTAWVTAPDGSGLVACPDRRLA